MKPKVPTTAVSPSMEDSENSPTHNQTLQFFSPFGTNTADDDLPSRPGQHSQPRAMWGTQVQENCLMSFDQKDGQGKNQETLEEKNAKELVVTSNSKGQ